MVVISIEIEQSAEEIVSGIPKTVTITASTSAPIFYTLDGSEPTIFSEIYVSAIFLPTDSLTLTLKAMATDGIDTSPVISETYFTNLTVGKNARLAHSATSAQAGDVIESRYPFGSSSPDPNTIFLSSGDVGITVNDPSLEQIIDGYGADGEPNSFTNEEYTTENYSIKYSDDDAIGQMGNGIGSLPNNITVTRPVAPPNTTNQFSVAFDPRALVIFQDVSLEDPNDPPYINREFFSLENSDVTRDGNNYYNTGLDSPPVSGSFLRSHFNARDNTMTYYYMDTIANKWIISKTPYNPTSNSTDNLGGMALSNRPGAKYVYEWRPFARRVLF